MNKAQIFILSNDDDIVGFISNIEKYHKRLDKECLLNIINKMSFPLSIVFESCYVDKLYRDTYYLYYSSKHSNYDRNCHRLSFFNGEISLTDFYDENKFKTLNNNIIGTMTLRPLIERSIGRTLLNPSKLKNISAYIRTTDFSVEILGNIFTINAFPFLSQDGEVMTCAETTIWNIVEYYGTRYAEYKTILPNDIIRKLDNISSERVLPSTGLDYFRISNLLKEFSFSPKLYANQIYDINTLKTLFHYYVESGIPLALGIEGEYNNRIARHSVVCIGHSTSQFPLSEVDVNYENNVPYINTSQLYNKYVIMDDNQIPYVIEDFNDLTLYDNSRLQVFVAPLYKRIFLEAGDVDEIVYECLKSLKLWDYIRETTLSISNTNPIVIRIFLTSSRKYKSFRTHHIYPNELREIYSQILYPKFIWVAEISTYELYQNRKILGEIVLDATSTRKDLSDSIILIKYKNRLGYSNKDTLNEHSFKLSEYNNLDQSYDMYVNNLREV